MNRTCFRDLPQAIAAFAALLLAAVPLSAQEPDTDDKKDTPPAASADDDAKPKDDAKPADDAPAPPGTAEGAKQAFAAANAEWKDLLGKMRDLRTKYKEAADAEKEPLEAEWKTLVASGRDLLTKLRETGAKAYAAAPNEDRELTRLLADVVADENRRDLYVQADALARTLVENEAELASLHNEAGIAAFAVGDFERADNLLKRAEDEGSLNDVGRKFLDSTDDYKKYWEAEEKIREAEAAKDDLPRVKFTTSKGDVTIELFENEAPNAVANFITLVEDGFYDGVVFHRVIAGFMAQGGDPDGTGSGGPGYTIPCECYQDNARMHFRGTLSMAHAGKDTGGSQFFITFLPTPHLNKRHTAFGRVIAGMDAVGALNRSETSGGPVRGFEPDKIIKAEVVRKRDHEYKVKKTEDES